MSSASETPISVYSSLSRSKIPFAPLDPAGKKLTWYCCGPTVYDASHLGHARNYVSTDVLRRILRDYFGYDVVFVQNVTDVDDKIINRARERHFFNKFKTEHPVINEDVLAEVQKAFSWYGSKTATFPEGLVPAGFAGWIANHAELLRKLGLTEDEIIFRNRLNALSETADALLKGKSTDADSFYSSVDGVFSLYLGDTGKKLVAGNDHAMFADYARYWENDFDQDMRMLNVLPPTITTRVSEFIPENIAFVQKIIDNGFAYAIPSGTVYFDISAYEKAGHEYPQLEQGMKDNEVEAEELEPPTNDALLSSVEREKLGEKRQKRNRRDFALWKKSREGEPSWDSPWGPGRPGWHIECSAMCSKVLGSRVDVHSGGIDLAFPHHDNELAQSEAYWHHEHKAVLHSENEVGGRGWIKYFFHMGHLSIAGSKMSKSLKNFITIREALATGEWTPRRLRVVFMMGGWKNGIEITPGMKRTAETWELTLNNFFASVRALTSEEEGRERAGKSSPHLFRQQEKQLYDDLSKAQADMQTALSDSFNTATALDVISDIVSKANTYLVANQKSLQNPDAYYSVSALREIARWVTRMVEIFGLETVAGGGDRIGWSISSASGGVTAGSNAEEIAMPYVRVLSRFRDAAKQAALTDPKSELGKQLLALCDSVRDDDLVSLGVSLEDRNSAVGEPALVKFVPAQELIATREEKRRGIEQKAAETEAKRLKKEGEAREREEKAKVSPTEMFKIGEYEGKYKEWDAEGLPMMNGDGTEVTKTQRSKLQKLWEKQKRLYDGWKAAQTTVTPR